MSQHVRLLHPAGPDRRALVRYLEGAGWTVDLVAAAADLRLASDGATLAHADAFTDVRATPSFDASCVLLAPDAAARSRLAGAGAAAVRVEPCDLAELEADLRRAAAAPRPETARPQAGPPPPSAAAPVAPLVDEVTRDACPALLKAVGAALSPGISAAEGWLRLLLQDIDVSDPAHRLISHARREIRELERVVRWLRMAAFESPAYLAPTPLNDVIRSALESFGPAPIPLTLDLADDLPEVRADSRHLRSALDGLLRGVFDPPTRPERVDIATSSRDGEVRFVLREHGNRLDDEQIAGLATPGLALLHAGFERAMGFSVAKRLLERQDVAVDVRAEPVARLQFRAVFEAVGARFSRSQTGRAPAEGGR